MLLTSVVRYCGTHGAQSVWCKAAAAYAPPALLSAQRDGFTKKGVCAKRGAETTRHVRARGRVIAGEW